jgi:hypothetical protein
MQLHANAAAIGIVTAQSLISAPGAGKRITVLGYVVSVGATASDVALIDSVTAPNTKTWKFGASGHAESGLARWELSDNGPTDVEVDYLIEATGGTGNWVFLSSNNHTRQQPIHEAPVVRVPFVFSRNAARRTTHGRKPLADSWRVCYPKNQFDLCLIPVSDLGFIQWERSGARTLWPTRSKS